MSSSDIELTIATIVLLEVLFLVSISKKDLM